MSMSTIKRTIAAFLLSAMVLLLSSYAATTQTIGPTTRLRVAVWDYSQNIWLYLTTTEMWPRLIEGTGLPVPNTILHRVTPVLTTEEPVIGSSCADLDLTSIWVGRQGLFACTENEQGARIWSGVPFGWYTNPIIVGAALPNATVGVPYSQSLVASGGRAPFTWSITGGKLPTGLALSSTGIISGTATELGEFFVMVTVTDITHATSYATFASVPTTANGG